MSDVNATCYIKKIYKNLIVTSFDRDVTAWCFERVPRKLSTRDTSSTRICRNNDTIINPIGVLIRDSSLFSFTIRFHVRTIKPPGDSSIKSVTRRKYLNNCRHKCDKKYLLYTKYVNMKPEFTIDGYSYQCSCFQMAPLTPFPCSDIWQRFSTHNNTSFIQQYSL